jgi:predicted adenine nucleotide alpha hydrolase (AANH) superfamily ATPase
VETLSNTAFARFLYNGYLLPFEKITMPRNYQQELDRLLRQNKKEGKAPTLFLHSCCAPCSSYVLEYLSQYFRITLFYYNPNIYPQEEYDKRIAEQEKLISRLQTKHPIAFVTGEYDTSRFYAVTKGLEKEPEGGDRCFDCYELRMEEAANIAQAEGFDYFATTLSISPLKNAQKINEIGEKLSEKYGIKHLPSDFKKRSGYLRSIQLANEYDLYRQTYCGCLFSLKL